MKYTSKDLTEARNLIADEVNHTPIVRSEYLNALVGADLYFKCENLQKAGAFKYRGATHAIRRILQNESPEYVATHSSGNHGRALALAAKKNSIKCFVVVPENAPKVKVEGMRREGAEIIFCEPTIKAREKKLQELLQSRDAKVVHPYNDPLIILGQSSCAQEILEELEELDVLVCPVGGGGLLSGTALAGKRFGKNIKVYAGEPANADDAYRSMKSGKIEDVGNPQTIADGLRTNLGEHTFELIKEYVDDIFRVSEQEILDAMKLIWSELKQTVEPSCAVPLAAILKNKAIFAGRKTGVILTGGNVDLNKKYF